MHAFLSDKITRSNSPADRFTRILGRLKAPIDSVDCRCGTFPGHEAGVAGTDTQRTRTADDGSHDGQPLRRDAHRSGGLRRRQCCTVTLPGPPPWCGGSLVCDACDFPQAYASDFNFPQPYRMIAARSSSRSRMSFLEAYPAAIQTVVCDRVAIAGSHAIPTESVDRRQLSCQALSRDAIHTLVLHLPERNPN